MTDLLSHVTSAAAGLVKLQGAVAMYKSKSPFNVRKRL